MDSLQTMQSDLSQILGMARAQATQFTRSKLPQLSPEYKKIMKVVHSDPNIEVNSLLKFDTEVMLFDGKTIPIPANSKLLVKLPDESKRGEGVFGNFPLFHCSWGIQWSEDEFVSAAVQLGHPKSFLKALPIELKKVIQQLSMCNDADVICARAAWLQRWVKRANELRAPESNLHMTIDDDGAKVVVNKRILLFKEMLADAGYYDPGIADILKDGVPIVGPVEESGHFSKTFKPALISTDLLCEKARDINAAIISGTKSSGDPARDEFVYALKDP